MELKALEFKEYSHISLIEIYLKYNEVKKTELIQFSLDELKSLLSLLFSMKYHLSENKVINEKLFYLIKGEKNNLINVTRDFGRQLIENLDENKTKRLKSLSNEKYDLINIFRNNALVDFTETTLLNYMTFRSIEYGDFFLSRFSKEVLNNVNLNFHSERINRALKDQSYPLRKIGEKVYNSNSLLSTQDELLISFLLEENLLKTKLNTIQYGLINYIAKANIFKIEMKIRIYKQTIDKILGMRWNLNKGMGGPRRG